MMIRQSVRKAIGTEPTGWVVTTYGVAHVYRECWTAGNKQDALNVAREERIAMCQIMADEVGG